MKSLMVLTLSGMLACAGMAWAADASAQKKGGPPGMEQRMEMLTKQLELTADQQAKVKALFAEQADQMREARGKAEELTQEQRREKMMAGRKEFDAKMKSILTAEQYQKWEKHRQSRMPEGRPGSDKKGEKKAPGEAKQ